MKHRIALLADVHGNATALQAVVEDSIRQNVTEYWFLGDLILPGPGGAELFQILEQVNTTVFVKGNWEDCFLDVLVGNVDLTDPSDLYLAKLSQSLFPKLQNDELGKLKRWPLQEIKKVHDLHIGISHNLPQQNYGGALLPTNEQQHFDQLFSEGENIDIAVYAHVHHPLMRYGSQEQLIINPGSIGQPFNKWPNLQPDLRAQYAILEIDGRGFSGVDFRKVAYDVQKEIDLAEQASWPYLALYKELLQTGKAYTHDHELLGKLNVAYQYEKDVRQFLAKQIVEN
ncbi:metallophosphoesterase family protein [Listeria costaricensis]|uniref:metallophosphoesterase family protein n=1 Tax=Listeria costaricensis TaxID=2026604 RepID=UPI000C07958B|nr:metallophosphoesterase family protein [Listeria costaricensis]